MFRPLVPGRPNTSKNRCMRLEKADTLVWFIGFIQPRNVTGNTRNVLFHVRTTHDIFVPTCVSLYCFLPTLTRRHFILVICESKKQKRQISGMTLFSSPNTITRFKFLAITHGWKLLCERSINRSDK